MDIPIEVAAAAAAEMAAVEKRHPRGTLDGLAFAAAPVIVAWARKDIEDELAAQGLPPGTSLAKLIEHHRGNAGVAAAFDGLGAGLKDGARDLAKRVLDAGVDHTSTCDAWTDVNGSDCTCGVHLLDEANGDNNA